MKIYGSKNRQFLGTDNALFLILRLTLQNLAQTRLLRVSAASTFANIENKLDTISFSVDSPADRNQILNSIKRTHDMLDSAQKHRIKTMSDYGVRHSTLLEACTGPTNSHNHQVSPNSHTPQGSGHSIDESEHGYLNGEPDNNHSNGNGVNTPILCSPCNVKTSKTFENLS